ncbi:hypothetical protein, partial [Thiorhodococcus fuscus]
GAGRATEGGQEVRGYFCVVLLSGWHVMLLKRVEIRAMNQALRLKLSKVNAMKPRRRLSAFNTLFPGKGQRMLVKSHTAQRAFPFYNKA